MSAESAFLPILSDIHSRFPGLRIVLEHLSTAAAVSAVGSCGKTVAASITAHHLSLIVDSWQNDVHCNCKVSILLPINFISCGRLGEWRRILKIRRFFRTYSSPFRRCKENLLTAMP